VDAGPGSAGPVTTSPGAARFLSEILQPSPCRDLLQELLFSVRIDMIRFQAGCHKRRLNQALFGFVRFGFWGFLCYIFEFLVLSWCCRFDLSVP